MKAIELINKMFPKHDKSSCNDNDDTQNSFYFEGDKQERSSCIRCSLLKIIELSDELPYNFDGHKVIYG